MFMLSFSFHPVQRRLLGDREEGNEVRDFFRREGGAHLNERSDGGTRTAFNSRVRRAWRGRSAQFRPPTPGGSYVAGRTLSHVAHQSARAIEGAT